MAVRVLTLSEIARAVGGLLVPGANGVQDAAIHAVFSDSRNVPSGGLFVALRGETFDGHDFIISLANTAAAAVLCERRAETPLPQVLVRDSSQAFLDLASYYRSLFSIPVVALTGSVGKTTTKEMVACVMGARYRTLKTEGNLNNEVGLPKTLFKLEDSHEAAVIEMGMNHFGEIRRLTRCTRPDMAVITNIGMSHIEHLGSRENILKAKLEILEGLKPGSPVIVNGDDALLSGADLGSHRRVSFGVTGSGLDVRASNIMEEDGKTFFLAEIFGQKQEVWVPAVGIHNVYNALAACAVGALLEIPSKKIAVALGDYVPAGMRQRMRAVAGIEMIEDCYNASPDSVKAAVTVLASRKGGKRIAVLGDMLELGEYEVSAHRLAGEYVARAGIDVLFTYGERSKDTAKAAMAGGVGKVYSFTDGETLAQLLADTAEPGDTVLFKASNGMHLETVMGQFYALLEKTMVVG